MPTINTIDVPVAFRSTTATSALITPSSRKRFSRLCTAETDSPTFSAMASALSWQSR
jgi:hypothetical protein